MVLKISCTQIQEMTLLSQTMPFLFLTTVGQDFQSLAFHHAIKLLINIKQKFLGATRVY